MRLWAFAWPALRRDARAPRRGAAAGSGAVSTCGGWWDSRRQHHGVRVPGRRGQWVRRRLPGLGRWRALVGRAGLLRADVAGSLPVPGHALPAAAAAVRAAAGRCHEEPPHIPAGYEPATWVPLQWNKFHFLPTALWHQTEIAKS